MGAYCVYPDEYRPRQPRRTSLFRLLNSHYEELRNVYNERFSKRYGFWRPITDEVIEKYLRCGDPHYGFARIRCKECGASSENLREGMFRAVWSVSGRNRRFYWNEYAILEKFQELLEIKIPIA